jgi:predicted ATPase
MRIAISGSSNTGKSTLINAFKKRWPMYMSPQKTYRDILKENDLNHSSSTSSETQLIILDWMMTEQKKFPKGSKTIFDRCSYDNLAYTLQGNALNLIPDTVAAASISLVRESLKDLDIIFWLKYNPDIKTVDNGTRETNIDYIMGTEKVFQDLFDQYMENLESDVFFPKEDCPAIIAIDNNFSSVDDRLMFIGEFLDKNGILIETENSILDLENNDILTNMIGDQQKAQEADERLLKIIKEFKQ